jgi:hypothetical protein
MYENLNSLHIPNIEDIQNPVPRNICTVKLAVALAEKTEKGQGISIILAMD